MYPLLKAKEIKQHRRKVGSAGSVGGSGKMSSTSKPKSGSGRISGGGNEGAHGGGDETDDEGVLAPAPIFERAPGEPVSNFIYDSPDEDDENRG